MKLEIWNDEFIDTLVESVFESTTQDECDASVYVLSEAIILNYLGENICNNFTTFTESHGFVSIPLFEMIQDENTYDQLIEDVSIIVAESLLGLDEGIADKVRGISNRIAKKQLGKIIKGLNREKQAAIAKLKRVEANLGLLAVNSKKWEAQARDEARKQTGMGFISRKVAGLRDKTRVTYKSKRALNDQFRNTYKEKRAALEREKEALRKEVGEIRGKMKAEFQKAREVGIMWNGKLKKSAANEPARRAANKANPPKRKSFQPKLQTASYDPTDLFTKRAEIIIEKI